MTTGTHQPDRRSVLKATGATLLAAAGATGAATAASGDDTTVYESANYSWTDTEGRPDDQFSQSTASVDESTNTAEALATVSQFGEDFSKTGIAETGVQFHAWGEETKTLDVTVTGEFASQVSATSGSGAGARVAVVARDLDAEEVVAETAVSDLFVAGGDGSYYVADSATEPVSASLTADFAGGTDYAVALQVRSQATALDGGQAEADQEADTLYDFDGGATWDRLELTEL